MADKNLYGPAYFGLRDVLAMVIADEIQSTVDTSLGCTYAANRVMDVLEQRHLLESLHWTPSPALADLAAGRKGEPQNES